MPFYNNIYYPYMRETQGTQSSAGIPSLLTSPQSQPYTSGPPAMSASSSSTIPPFKFRQRRESVDWRRVSAVDVDLVASELDFLTLQEHIQGVTFCSVEGERCPRCQSPVDPALLKLFRLAQLTVEYLLHSQEVLSLSLQAAEDRLRAAGLDRDQVLAQQQKQAEEIMALKSELKHRKKLIRNQQNMLASRLTNCHKCQHCDKAFMSSSFLQNHMQRRHPEEYDSQCRSESERKKQMTSLKEEVFSLKEEVFSLKEELNQQHKALQAKTIQEKEQLAVQEQLDRLDRKLQDTTGGIRRELDMFHRSSAQLQLARQDPEPSGAPPQAERDQDQAQDQALHRLRQQIKQQDRKWESALQKMKTDHENETVELQRELSRLQSSLVEQQDRSLRLREEMSQRLQDKELTIMTQREQIRHISLNPPTKVVEVPVLVPAPAAAPKPSKAMSEQPPSATKLDPIEEMSEEEKDSGSVSERSEVKRPEVKKPEVKQEGRKQQAAVVTVTTPRVRRKIHDIQRELRSALESALLEKLEALGVRASQAGLGNRQYSDLMAQVRLEREGVAREVPHYWHHRKDVANTLEQRLKAKKTGEQQAKPRTPTQVTQSRARSSSLPSRVTQVMSGPTTKQVQPPQPAPRTKTSTLPQTSTSRTPPFSSDDESEDEEEEEEEEEHPQKRRQEPGPQHKAPPPRTAQPQPRPSQGRQTHTKPTPARTSLTKPAGSSLSQTQPPAPKAPAVNKNQAAKTAVVALESEGEWSDGSELEEIDLQQLQKHTDQNGNVGKTTNSNLVKHLANSLEKHLPDRAARRPAGGVSTLPESKDVVRELKYTNMDESSEDWDVSSLEDLALPEGSKPAAPSSAPVRKSLDSSGTSVWGTSTGKRGLSETGSTLKSSLVSVSDFSDSEDL